MEKCFLGFVDTVNESIAMKCTLKPGLSSLWMALLGKIGTIAM